MSAMCKGCTALTDISPIYDLDTAHITDMSDMFSGCTGLTAFDFSKIDTSDLLTTEAMFRGSGIKKADLAGITLPNVENMESMYCDCTQLEEVDFSGAKLPKLPKMEYLFYHYSGVEPTLKTANLSGLSVPACESMKNLFYKCKQLEKVDFSNVNMPANTSFSNLFEYCEALTDVCF